jgi:tetraprenyl-beta-curcumene synthase
MILEFLDDLHEHTTCTDEANGRQLHLALSDAVTPNTSISNYYRYHPQKDDHGYLGALVGACRESCILLPRYLTVSELVVREAHRAQVLALNHDPRRRDDKLRAWAEQEFPDWKHNSWFELSGAATASLTVHALLALAAESSCAASDIDHVQAAYFPWLSLATTMLDSYVDWPEDTAKGDHSYIDHYPNLDFALRRIDELIRRSTHEALAMRNGHRHAVIVACMIAMYMSRDSARTVERRTTTLRFVRAGGSLTRLLLPILRIWRIANALHSA